MIDRRRGMRLQESDSTNVTKPLVNNTDTEARCLLMNTGAGLSVLTESLVSDRRFPDH